MNKFPESLKLPKLTEEQIDNLNSSIFIKEIDCAHKTFQ